MIALTLAALLTVGLAIAHSWLGEVKLISPLLAPPHPAGLLSSRWARSVLRFGWHIASLAWVGLAGILLVLAHGAPRPAGVLAVLAATLAAHGAVILVCSRGRHLAWPAFLAAAALTAVPLAQAWA